jgi:hypothetical protein
MDAMATKVAKKELWKNVSPGLRYYLRLDPIGNQTHGVVQAGKTFTISDVERQLNQEIAHDPKADLFRNGTFVLVKPTKNTIEDEVESVNSLSDHEIETAVSEMLGDDEVPLDLMMETVTSAVTAERILEELVIQDAPQSWVDRAKVLIKEHTDYPIGQDGKPMEVVEREVIETPSVEEGFRASRAVRPR